MSLDASVSHQIEDVDPTALEDIEKEASIVAKEFYQLTTFKSDFSN
jgi:hypothetical protein